MSVIISLISPPGGGKTTILKKISENLDVPILSSGDIARQMQREMQEDFLLQGNLAPEDEMRRRIKNEMDKLLENHPVVLADGFPRFIEQYEWMKTSFPSASIVLYHLDVSYDIILERLRTRGRADDNAETLKVRMKKYEDLTFPIVQKYNVEKYNYDYVAQIIFAAKNNKSKEETEHENVLSSRSH